jgi:hypothetical protein
VKDIGDAFTFPFRDPNWPAKLLMGGFVTFLSMFLIGIPVLYGYLIALVRRVRDNEQHPLPEWKDLGVMFVSGLKYLVVQLVYSLPIIIIMVPFTLLMIIMMIGTGVEDPAEALPGMAAFMVAVIALGFYSLFITLLRPLIIVRFAEREEMGDALRIGAVLRQFRDRWQDCLVIMVITIAAGIAAVAGLLLFFVGIFITVFYAHLIEFHLCGQIAGSAEIETTTQES